MFAIERCIRTRFQRNGTAAYKTLSPAKWPVVPRFGLGLAALSAWSHVRPFLHVFRSSWPFSFFRVTTPVSSYAPQSHECILVKSTVTIFGISDVLKGSCFNLRRASRIRSWVRLETIH